MHPVSVGELSDPIGKSLAENHVRIPVYRQDQTVHAVGLAHHLFGNDLLRGSGSSDDLGGCHDDDSVSVLRCDIWAVACSSPFLPIVPSSENTPMAGMAVGLLDPDAITGTILRMDPSRIPI